MMQDSSEAEKKDSPVVSRALLAKSPVPPGGEGGVPSEAAKAGVDALGTSAATPAPNKPVARLEAPAWWRPSPAPLIALIFSCYAADCLLSGFPLGVGAALGVWLAAMAVLALRRDLPVYAVLLISLGSVLNAAALVIQGAWWSVFLGVLIVPAVLYMPRWEQAESNEKAAPSLWWWNYWFHRPEEGTFCRWGRVLAWVLSILVGLVLFCVFLNIFAAGNPVVAMVRTWLEYVAGRWLGWLAIDWTFFQSLFKWFLGFIFFGFVLLPLRKRVHVTGEQPQPAKPLLPALPLVMLLFINLAFLIANGADVAFLWLAVLPEGVSQTSYLYQGVESLVWAAVLAAVFLLGIFRSRGSVRGSVAGRIAGYVLVLQTGLLAASVALRLIRQIEAHGFSPFRVDGFLCLASGLVLLALLAGYMAGRGNFRRYLGYAAVVGYFVLTLLGICTPAQISGRLNLALMDDRPEWRFTARDMEVFGVEQGENIPLAIAVYQKLSQTNPEEAALLRECLSKVELRAEFIGKEPESWRHANLRQDAMRYDAEWLREVLKAAPKPNATVAETEGAL